MIKLKEGERTLPKKWFVICTICIVTGMIFVNRPQRPRLISSITTMETAYLTILVDEAEITDLEKLKKKIIHLCKIDGFQEIKLQTEDRVPAKRYYISIYISENDLKEGKEYLTFKLE